MPMSVTTHSTLCFSKSEANHPSIDNIKFITAFLGNDLRHSQRVAVVRIMGASDEIRKPTTR